MSTDCYAVVFADGDTGIFPVSRCDVVHKATWVMNLDHREQCDISQVWHCPSPVEAAEILRTLAEDPHDHFDPGDRINTSTLLCRNPAPKEKP